MSSSSAQPQSLKVWCVQVCMFYFTLCLCGWPLSSEAARLRCGTDLLSDLIFVCGDRGIYLGKGSWSGYGARPRGKGIVDQCCRRSGCELQHLELYCAKPKSQTSNTVSPSTTTTSTESPTTTTASPSTTISTASPSTTTTTTSPSSTKTSSQSTTTTATPQTSPQPDTAQQQFQKVFHRRLLEHLGPPNSPKREVYRRKKRPSIPGKSKGSSSRRKLSSQRTTSRPPASSRSPVQRVTRPGS